MGDVHGLLSIVIVSILFKAESLALTSINFSARGPCGLRRVFIDLSQDNGLALMNNKQNFEEESDCGFQRRA
jgi:hypothetical protein